MQLDKPFVEWETLDREHWHMVAPAFDSVPSVYLPRRGHRRRCGALVAAGSCPIHGDASRVCRFLGVGFQETCDEKAAGV